MLRVFSVFALAGFLASAPPADAQSIPSAYRYLEESQEAGVSVGYVAADRGRFGFAPGPDIVYEARYGLELAGPLGIEGLVSLMPTTRHVIDPGRDEGDRVVDEAEMALATIEVRLRFALTGRRTWHGVQPYFSVGGGFAFDAQGAQAEDGLLQAPDRFDFGTKFMGAVGTGVRIPLSDRFVLRGEASARLWKIDIPDGYRDPERDFGIVPDSEWTNAPGLTLGLAYRW